MEQEGFRFSSTTWTLTVMVATAIIAILVISAKIVFFEQTESGQYAVHQECEKHDESCLADCDDSSTGRGISCSSCCISWKNVYEPIGLRLKNMIIRGSLVGLFLGFLLAQFSLELASSKGWIK